MNMFKHLNVTIVTKALPKKEILENISKEFIKVINVFVKRRTLNLRAFVSVYNSKIL